MPTINKLGGSKAPVASAPVEHPKADIVTTGEAGVTLIESKAVPTNGVDFKSQISKVKIPSFLQTAMPETSEREQTGYIGFCSDASKHFPEMQSAGLENGDIFLNTQGQYIKCPQLDFFLVSGESFKSVMDQSGRFLYATRDLSVKEARPKINGKERFFSGDTNPKLNPHYICLCIVNPNGRFIPIKGDFIGTKSGGIESAISAVRAAGDEKSGWLRLSEAHQTTAAFPVPFGRVFHQMRTKGEVAKSSGMAYHRTVTVSGPANLSQMQSLLAAMGDEEFNASLEEAHKNYTARVEFMDKIVKGENPYNQA